MKINKLRSQLAYTVLFRPIDFACRDMARFIDREAKSERERERESQKLRTDPTLRESEFTEFTLIDKLANPHT